MPEQFSGIKFTPRTSFTPQAGVGMSVYVRADLEGNTMYISVFYDWMEAANGLVGDWVIDGPGEWKTRDNKSYITVVEPRRKA